MKLLILTSAVAAIGIITSNAAAQQCCTGNVSSYCTAGTSVQGCAPAIRGEGVPDTADASGFDIVVGDLPSQRMGLIFYGMSAIPQPQPWALGSSSYLCVYYPVARTGARSSGGLAGTCTGELRVDFNAFMTTNPSALGGPFTVGQQFIAQGWYRDPGAAKGTNLSDALRFSLCANADDTTPPVITTCASNQTVSAGANCQGIVPDFTAGVLASDNCAGALSVTQAPAAGSLAGMGMTPILITVTDPALNFSNCVATLMVADTTGPIFTTCPSNQVVPANSNCQAIVPDFTANVVATDACGGPVVIAQSPLAGTVVDFFASAVTITAIDSRGNTSVCSALLSISPSPSCGTLPGLVLVQPGTFQMGSGAGSGAPYFNDLSQKPVHQVTISYQFWMWESEVTQAQYHALTSGGSSTNPLHPVTLVTWHQARAFCSILNAAYSVSVPVGYEFRLPTEAEWEYACRAGSTTEFNVGSSLLCSQASFFYSYHSNSFCGSTGMGPAKGYPPNAWGLYGMHGNAAEWCLDSYASYSATAVVDPFVTGGALRIARGGSWLHESDVCRSAHRYPLSPNLAFEDFGFRVVLAPILVP